MQAAGVDSWMAAMRRGEFAAAWRISDAVLRRRLREGQSCAGLPRHQQFLWDGSPLAGKRVLVHCYHGLGDTLQYVRLLPRLRAQCREVVLWAQPALLGLLCGVAGADRLEDLHDGAPAIDRDADVELMELAHILRLRATGIPHAVPDLHVPRPAHRSQRAAGPRIGLAWRAGDWDPARSVPDELLAPLAALPGVRWTSLQYPPVSPPLPMHECVAADLVEVARCMCTLDLVVSVDTMTAHLAGALGVPVWALLPTPCDWRWMERRTDTPWYPTMRLLRQRRVGDWAEVVARLCAALATLPGASEGAAASRASGRSAPAAECGAHVRADIP